MYCPSRSHRTNRCSLGRVETKGSKLLWWLGPAWPLAQLSAAQKPPLIQKRPSWVGCVQLCNMELPRTHSAACSADSPSTPSMTTMLRLGMGAVQRSLQLRQFSSGWLWGFWGPCSLLQLHLRDRSGKGENLFLYFRAGLEWDHF